MVPHSSRQNEVIEMVVPRAARRKRLPLEFGSLGITAAGVVVGSIIMNVIVFAIVSSTGLIINNAAKLIDLKDKERGLKKFLTTYT